MSIDNMFNLSKLFITSKKKFHKINPTISCGTIEAIEKKYHFSLPIEYREFISKIGNGGVLPLFENEVTELVAFDEDMGFEHIQEEFLLQDSCDWGNIFKDHCQLDIDEFLTTKNKGYVQIASTDSCHTTAWLLIITGIRRGEVWLRDEYGLLRLPNVNFAEWLNLYLNNQLFSKVQELSAQNRAERKTNSLLQQIQECVTSKRCEQIQWNAPVSIEEVHTFEREHNITLPIEYVEFITKVADGCSNFFATNSKGQGGIMFRLKDFSDLKGLDRPFLFEENTEKIRSDLLRNYDRQHNIWQSELFTNLSKDEAVSSVWASSEYSLIPGVLPFIWAARFSA